MIKPTLFLFALTLGLAAAEDRPNVILIMSDDMGISDIGCYGSEIDTPRLDALAGDGLRFTQFYNTARCCPTRASLLSGLYPHQAGVGHMMNDRGHDGYRGELNRECLTIAEALKTAGYGTYMAGKWHITTKTAPDGPKDNWPRQRGFDRFYGTIHGAGSLWDPNSLTRDNTQMSPDNDPEYKPEKRWFYTDAISDQTARFIREHVKETPSDPFFCYVSYTAAHWPMHAREETIAKYKGRYDAGYEAFRKSRLEKMKKLGIVTPDTSLSPAAEDWSKVQNIEWETRCMEVYAAMVDEMDQGIGRIVDTLKEIGQFDNTLILFLQDNGGCAENFGRGGKSNPRADKPTLDPMAKGELQMHMQPKQTRDGYPVRTGVGVMPGPDDTYIAYGRGWANVSNTPFREYKHWVHEGGISTPLIAHWPKGIARKGELDHQPSHLIDIMATCVDLGGVDYPKVKIKPLEGRSLDVAFKGGDIERDALFWEHEGNCAIRKGNWKLVRKENKAWELYDISSDRIEANDLAAKKPDLVEKLAAEFQNYADRANVSPVGMWKGKPKGKKKVNKQTRFELKSGDTLDGEDAPNIAGQAITVSGRVKSSDRDGVIVAQGGDAQGFALVQSAGHLAFVTCVGGEVSVVKSDKPLSSGNFSFEVAMNEQGNVTLSADQKKIASGKVIPCNTIPLDGLAVGSDPVGTVGNYDAPNPLDGDIHLVLELGQKKKSKSKKDTPMSPVTDDPKLPRVLLIGDSISIGYTVDVRKMLAGVANVHRPLTNCGPTTNGLRNIDKWLGDGKWDVIHFNWGLHDLKYVAKNSDKLVAIDSPGARQQVPPDNYEKNLTKLVERLKKTGAKLIWRNTTPVPEGAAGRIVGDAAKYNEIAARVMKKHDVAIHDLYAFAKKNEAKIQLKANVHYSPAGSKRLAEEVVREIKAKFSK